MSRPHPPRRPSPRSPVTGRGPSSSGARRSPRSPGQGPGRRERTRCRTRPRPGAARPRPARPARSPSRPRSAAARPRRRSATSRCAAAAAPPAGRPAARRHQNPWAQPALVHHADQSPGAYPAARSRRRPGVATRRPGPRRRPGATRRPGPGEGPGWRPGGQAPGEGPGRDVGDHVRADLVPLVLGQREPVHDHGVDISRVTLDRQQRALLAERTFSRRLLGRARRHCGWLKVRTGQGERVGVGCGDRFGGGHVQEVRHPPKTSPTVRPASHVSYAGAG